MMDNQPNITPSRFNLKKAYQVFLHVALVLLAIEVIILSLENRELRKGQQPIAQYHLKPGDTLSLSSLESLTGNGGIDTSSTQLLFLFTTKCPFCKLNIPNWKTLADFAQRNKIQVNSVSLDLRDSTARFLKSQNITFPVYVPKNPAAFKTLNRISSVPQTVVLSRAGRVSQVWEGLLSEKATLEVKGYLASLPNN